MKQQKQQIYEAITFFENALKQYEIILKGDLRDEYREYIESMVLHYTIAVHALIVVHALNKILE